MPITLSDNLNIVVTSTPPVTGLPDAPPWAQVSPFDTVGRWAPFSLNTLADVDPANDPLLNPNFPGSAPWRQVSGQEGVFTLWNGGALATPDTYSTHGALCLYGGGHNGYAGSEVYTLDLGTRLWSRASDPYAGPFNFPYADGRYPDGSPVPPHTYYQQGYHPPSKSFFSLRGMTESSSTPSNSLDVANAHGLDLVNGTWRRTPIYNAVPGASVSFNSGGAACYDSLRDCFWVFSKPSSGLYGDSRFDLLKLFDLTVQNPDGTYGKWQRYRWRTQILTGCSVHHDPVDDLLIMLNYRDSPKATRVYPLANLGDDGTSSVIVEADGIGENGVTIASMAAIKTDGHGADWSPGLRSVVYMPRTAGTELYRLEKPATNWATNAWRWYRLTSPINTIAVPAQTTNNGIHSKFRVVKYRDKELAVVATRRDFPAYAMRIL